MARITQVRRAKKTAPVVKTRSRTDQPVVSSESTFREKHNLPQRSRAPVSLAPTRLPPAYEDD